MSSVVAVVKVVFYCAEHKHLIFYPKASLSYKFLQDFHLATDKAVQIGCLYVVHLFKGIPLL